MQNDETRMTTQVRDPNDELVMGAWALVHHSGFEVQVSERSPGRVEYAGSRVDLPGGVVPNVNVLVGQVPDEETF
jgi:hypothetical protein